MIISWLHLLGATVSLGSAVAMTFVFFPALKSFGPEQKMKIASRVLAYFHPLFLGALCVTFMTGAFRLTDLKDVSGALYYSTFGKILLWKFTLTMLIFLLASGQSFGMGLKFQRMINGVIPGDLALQEKYLSKIKRMLSYNLVLLLVILYVGLKLLPLVHGTALLSK